MKLVSIELHNIGLYRDQCLFFQYAENGVTLFWGNNGAGKTTLLSSIKISLLGQRAFASSEDYIDYVAKNLISSRLNKETGEASIRVSFELIEDNERVVYSLLRGWRFKDSTLTEDVSFYKKGEKLDFIQSERLQNKIHSILPPSLMDVLIFDGENAIDLLRKDQMPVLIKNIVYSIFGMDVYSKTTKDLALCLKGISNVQRAGEEEMRAIEIASRYKQALATQRGLKKLHEDVFGQKAAKQAVLNSYIRKLSQRIGMNFSEVESIKNDLSNLQDNRKRMQSDLRTVVEDILPFRILLPRLLELEEQANREQPYNVLKSIRALKYFFRDDSESLSDLGKLEGKVQFNEDEENVIGMSDADIIALRKAITLAQSYSKEQLASFVKDKNSAYDIIKGIVDSLGKLSDPAAKDLLSAIETCSDELDALCASLEELEQKLKASEEELAKAKKEYDDLKKRVSASKKSSNAYLEISRYKIALEDFVEAQTVSICERLNKAIYKDLSIIGYRNSSIKKIEIDPKTFDITLFEAGGKPIPSSVFSAGEKQILLGLILKNSLSISGIDGFFLFDTPVGRLDMSNRSIFTNEVIFKVAKQVMVFATDSDYSKSDYEKIKNRLSAENILLRDENDQIVIVPGSIYKSGEGSL